MEQKRVYCLYRVSIQKQVDHIQQDDKMLSDIPMQKTACRRYCSEKGWLVVGEFQEAGVSGYKNPTFERTAVRQIIEAAHAGSFDILLVYTIDRLSRRDSEIPLLFNEITECGIAVWSVIEGEMRYQTSTDRLLVYLYGWKANGESERISQRISTIQHQMVLRGDYRGGAVPFGYKLVENGLVSKQGHRRHDLAIHEPEAAIVRTIFAKIADEGYSMYELTRYLSTVEFADDVRPRVWRSSSLHVMLRNPIYVGRLRFNDELSLPFPHLQIVDPMTFQQVQQLTRYKKHALPSGRPAPVAPPLYHDILYCGHCGSHLVHSHAFHIRQDGTANIRYLYRCYNKERFTRRCDGACTYSARIIDADIHRHTECLVSMLLTLPESMLVSNAVELARVEFLSRRDKLRQQLNELNAQLGNIQKSVADALTLYGVSATTELQLLYGDVKVQRDGVYHELQQLEAADYEPQVLAKTKLKELNQVRRMCELWRAGDANTMERLVPQFFDRIWVESGYQLRYEVMEEIRQFLIADMDEPISHLESQPLLLNAECSNAR